MEIVERDIKDGIALALSGEIDLHTSPKLRTALQQILEKKPPILLLDFSGVKYIDSSGLAVLIEYRRESASFQGRLAVYGMIPKVRMVFELVRLNEVFVLADTEQAALEALQQPS